MGLIKIASSHNFPEYLFKFITIKKKKRVLGTFVYVYLQNASKSQINFHENFFSCSRYIFIAVLAIGNENGCDEESLGV